MKKRLTGLVILVCACAVIFGIAVFVIVPRAAGISLPYHWANIPLGQPRTLVHQYLGKPSDTTQALTDGWVAKRENGDYQLTLTYNSDSVSTAYKLYFNYHLGFFHKQYLLVEK